MTRKRKVFKYEKKLRHLATTWLYLSLPTLIAGGILLKLNEFYNYKYEFIEVGSRLFLCGSLVCVTVAFVLENIVVVMNKIAKRI